KNGSKILGKSSCRIPVPVSMNSARISSRRLGFNLVRTVSTPREFIASIALSMSAMKHCTSRSASAWNCGRSLSSCRSIMSHLTPCGELLALRQALLGLTPRRHVFADRDDVGDILIVEPHRNLRDAVMPRFAGRLRVHLDSLDLPRREDAIELELQQLARLPIQDFEHFASERIFTRHALRPGFALPVPRPDAIAAIDDVEADRQRVDD